MPKIIFKEDYDYRPSANRRVTVSYKASPKAQAVNAECAERALGLGIAEEPKAPAKKSDKD